MGRPFELGLLHVLTQDTIYFCLIVAVILSIGLEPLDHVLIKPQRKAFFFRPVEDSPTSSGPVKSLGYVRGVNLVVWHILQCKELGFLIFCQFHVILLHKRLFRVGLLCGR